MELNSNNIKAKITVIDDCKINITGNVYNFNNFKSIIMIAPNTFDKKSSYSGQGLPFPCARIAFENTPNKYIIQSDLFETVFEYPNSYYTVANKKRVVSTIYFCFVDNNDKVYVEFIELEDLYPLRTLTNRETRKGPEFYSTKYDVLPIDTAESLMYQYSELKRKMKIA